MGLNTHINPNNNQNFVAGSKESYLPISSFQMLPSNSTIDTVINSNGSMSISSDILVLKTFCSAHQKNINDLDKI